MGAVSLEGATEAGLEDQSQPMMSAVVFWKGGVVDRLARGKDRMR